MNIVAFAASSSKASINKQLLGHALSLLSGVNTDILDLNDYELPLFSVDREAELGQPERAKAFLAKLAAADALVVSFAEHNGSYSAAYKNLFDWCSRINTKVFQGKPMIMLSTSPGARGGASVLAAAVGSASFFAGEVQASLSIPSFYDNFDRASQTLTNLELQHQLHHTMNQLKTKAS
jgi:chromate reductase, NAD(P)H dehydrogenase (quinone)